MSFLFWRTALSVLLLSSLVFALTADDAARFYLKSGESMKLESINAGGMLYTLVKIDGEPSVVLAPSGSLYDAVTEKDALKPVLSVYAQQIYKAQGFPDSVRLINGTLPVIQTALGGCDRGAAIFLKNFPTRSVRLGKANIGLKYLIFSSLTYKADQDAYLAINSSYPAYHAAYAAFLPAAQGLAPLVDANDADAVLLAASTIRDNAATLKQRYDEISAAAKTLGSSKEFGAILNYTFYDQGNVLTCYPNVNASTDLVRIQNVFSDRSLRSIDQLVELVYAKTADRKSVATQGTAHAVRTEDLAKVESRIANVSSQFNKLGYSVEFKTALTKRDALKTSLESIKPNGTVESFDRTYQELNALLTSYQDALPTFKSASVLIKAASDNVTAAQKKYGDGDSRVQAYATELKGLKANFTTALNFLSSGDVPKASAQFAALSQQSSDLSSRSANLQAKGNDLDLPVIGGIALLVLVLGGTVWYFRKMKKQQPPMGS